MQSLKVPRPSFQAANVSAPSSRNTTDWPLNAAHCPEFSEHRAAVSTPLAPSSPPPPPRSTELQTNKISGAPASRAKEVQVSSTSVTSA